MAGSDSAVEAMAGSDSAMAGSDSTVEAMAGSDSAMAGLEVAVHRERLGEAAI